MKKNLRKKLSAFTLVEILVAMFAFSLIMMATMNIFTRAYSGYHMTLRIQHDLENAQYAMNVLAKMLRTSSVVSGSGSSVQFFDHSQDRCIQYRISGGAVQVASGVATTVNQCVTMALASFSSVTSGTVTGSFLVTASTAIGGPPSRIGKVTIALSVSEEAAHSARVQTTVSLRDFGNIDPYLLFGLLESMWQNEINMRLPTLMRSITILKL